MKVTIIYDNAADEGFHLKDENSETIDFIASALMKMGVPKIGPTHCTGKIAQTISQRRFGNRYIFVYAGKQLEV